VVESGKGVFSRIRNDPRPINDTFTNSGKMSLQEKLRKILKYTYFQSLPFEAITDNIKFTLVTLKKYDEMVLT